MRNDPNGSSPFGGEVGAQSPPPTVERARWQRRAIYAAVGVVWIAAAIAGGVGGTLPGFRVGTTRARSRSLDARARPERQAAARLSDERRPLAASGDEGPGRSTLSRRAPHL